MATIKADCYDRNHMALLRKLRTLIASLTIPVVLVASIGLIFRSQLSAVMWHLLHGRIVTWNNHSTLLPLFWRPVSSDGNGKLTLANATTFGPEVEVRFTKGTAALDSNADGLRWQQNLTKLMNSKAPPSRQYKPNTFVTKAGDVFCIDSAVNEVPVSFVCRVAGTDLKIDYLGSVQELQDARAIVADLE